MAVDRVRHLVRGVAVGSSVVGLVWGFSLDFSFLSFSVPYGRNLGGSEPIELQAEGRRGTAMREDLAIDNTTSAVRELEKMQLEGLLCSLSVPMNTNVIHRQNLKLSKLV